MITIVKEKPLLLDLFCGAGGAAVGYERAGFRVYRHRLFESNVLLFQPQHPRHRVKAAGPDAIAREGEFWSVGGHFGHKEDAALTMGVSWMQTVDEIA